MQCVHRALELPGSADVRRSHSRITPTLLVKCVSVGLYGCHLQHDVISTGFLISSDKKFLRKRYQDLAQAIANTSLFLTSQN